MRKYILISLSLSMLGLLSSGDGLLTIAGSILAIPFISLLQSLVARLAKLFDVASTKIGPISLLPSIIFFVWSILNVSIFTKASNIFKVVMGTDKPSCVKELYAFEDTWTDYTAQVYCKISPNELKKIIHDLKLEREEKPHYIEEKSLKETMIKEICDQPPIKNLIIYSYQKIKGEQFIYSRTLYTNKAYNRVFITYMAD